LTNIKLKRYLHFKNSLKNIKLKDICIKKFPPLKICLYRKIICIEKKIALKIFLIEKTASNMKMLNLKLLWALDVKSMYESFLFPLRFFF
jgi:hypothetical protein